MNYKNKIKFNSVECDNYYEFFVSYSEEGDEMPYFLEHITSETLHKEFIEDTSDDCFIYLMNMHNERW